MADFVLFLNNCDYWEFPSTYKNISGQTFYIYLFFYMKLDVIIRSKVVVLFNKI